jgi:two-component system, chemotaxis family, chemotaxis protein CheY
MEDQKFKNRILFCEDDLTSRVLLSTILKKRGYEIIGEAKSGIEAINLYDKLNPDIVLLDIQMPKGGGITTLRFMRELSQEPYIIMLTGDDTPHSVHTTKNLGANEYVLKTSIGEASFLNRLDKVSGLTHTESSEDDEDNNVDVFEEEDYGSEQIEEGVYNKEEDIEENIDENMDENIANSPDFEPKKKSSTPRRMVRYKRR